MSAAGGSGQMGKLASTALDAGLFGKHKAGTATVLTVMSRLC